MKHRMPEVVERQIMKTFEKCMKQDEQKFELTGLDIEHFDF